MSCRSDDLPLLATGRLTGLALWRTERHVKSCPACQQELHTLRQLSDSLRTITQAEPGADLDERVLSIRPSTLERSRISTQNRSFGGNLMRHPLLLFPLLGLSGASLFTFSQPSAYTSTGKLMIISANKTDSAASIPTFIELMKSTEIQKEVSLHMGQPNPTFTFEAIPHTPIIQVTGRGESPDNVSEAVNRLIKAMHEKIEVQQAMAKRTGRLPDFDGEVRIINEATTPTAPSTLSRTPTLAIGLLVGIFGGGLLTIFRRQS